MNTYKKGSRVRLEARRLLEAMGYLVEITERTVKYEKRDLFGIADLIGLKNNLVVFVQVSCNRPHTHSVFREFAKKYAGDNIHVEQWIHYDRAGFKVFKYDKFGDMVVIK